MEAALYDPDDGFFSAESPARPEGHFVTSAHVSPVFAGLLAVQLREVWRALGEPERFTMADVGAGDGTLARQLIASGQSDASFARALRVVAVERGRGARASLAGASLDVAESIDKLEPFEGCIIANELFDNVPFRIVRHRGESLVEVVIETEDDRLVEREAPAELPASIDVGDEQPVSLASLHLVDGIARVLQRGYAFIVDYGFVRGEQPEPIRGYALHRMVDDLLADPGGTDITGPVDFEALDRRARERGLQTWGPVSQRDALMALGYRPTLDRMRAEQAELEQRGDTQKALAYFGERGQAAMLVDPAGLGGLKVLALGTAEMPAPAAVR
jgi:NADH dehydrogenase [ubiquinone] 1 alpha subcomplex assembly factor 7